MKIELDTLETAIGAENVVMIIDTILEAMPGMCGQLRTAALSGNLRKVMHTAHQLKSDCGNVGATALREQLQQIETGAEDGTLTEPVAAVAMVSAEVEHFLQALRRARDVRARLQPTVNLTLLHHGA